MFYNQKFLYLCMWRNKFQLLKQTLNFSQNLEYFIKNLRNINDKSSTDKDSLLIDQENASENSFSASLVILNLKKI